MRIAGPQYTIEKTYNGALVLSTGQTVPFTFMDVL